MVRPNRTLIAMLCVLLSCGVAAAQNDRATNQFSRDYVKGLQLGNAPSSSTPSIAGNTGENGKKKMIRIPRMTAPLATPTRDEINEKLAGAKSNFIKVDGVGGILWAGDFPHFKKALADLTDVAMEHNLPVSEVVVVSPSEMMVPVMMYLNVGPLTDVLGSRGKDLLRVPQVVSKLKEHPGLLEKVIGAVQKLHRQTPADKVSAETKIKRLARIENRWRILPFLPDEYVFLERSPTFFVHTEYGNIVIEAQDKPFRKYFNKDGLFDIGPFKMFSGEQEVSIKEDAV